MNGYSKAVRSGNFIVDLYDSEVEEIRECPGCGEPLVLIEGDEYDGLHCGCCDKIFDFHGEVIGEMV